MTTARRSEIDAAFDAALDQPASRRKQWLHDHYRDDPALVGEVQALLAAHDRAEGILEASPVPRPLGARAAPPTDPQRRIGPYRVVREIGRGGMGVVYLAERDDGQYHRRVAVKLLRASPDADELHRRFLGERQILASLDHPNIAQLLDGGITEGQLPYLVMEYVEGLPITTYCDRHRLGLDERLRLFLDVCAAVRHAHQNLVVHRDLKPGNIFVTDDGRVKLLDFGIAKLLNPGLAGLVQPVTRTEFRVMTPEYASPEQIRGEPLSTASDVYSLGVVLYELLAGRRPYRLTTGSPRELATVIGEREPERPSSIATSVVGDDPAADPRAAAAARGTTPDRLRRSLQGDLDAIVMMALRKEPRRRYGTAERLARDIERFLDGRPVLAHRGSRVYRMRRFVARHRGSAVAAAIVVISLVGGSAVALWQGAAARADRDRAAAALRESEDVTRFLVGLFEASDPLEHGATAIGVRDLMQRASLHVEELGEQPLVQARMLQVMGRVYRNLADHDTSRRLLERSLAIRAAALDSTDPDVTATLLDLAASLRHQNRFPDAEAAARRGLRLRLLAGGDHQPDAAEFLLELSGLAVYRAALGAADSLAVEAVALRRRDLRPTDPLLASALERHAATRRRLGRSDEAERLLREALAIYSGRDSSGPSANATRLRLADMISQDRDDRDEAEALYRRAVSDLRARLGPEHPRAMYAANDYAGFLTMHGRVREAEPIVRANLDGMVRTFGPDHPSTASQRGLVARVVALVGRFAEAESLSRSALDTYERIYGRGSNAYIGGVTTLGRNLAAAGRLAEADSLMRLAIAIRRTDLQETDTPLMCIGLAGLAGVATARGAYAEADSLYQEALRILRLHTAEEHRDIRRVHAGLARLYDASGRPALAESHRRLAGSDVTPF